MIDDDKEGAPSRPPIDDDEQTMSSGDLHSPTEAETMSFSDGGATPQQEDRHPETIAGYTILGELGRGGMGVVWEALQERPKRRVALKVMRRDHKVDEVHQRMFQREAETLARLKHPNIGAIYESGHTEDGHDYFAMELLQGQTLDRWLADRPERIDADEIELRLRLFRTICEAVHYAHQRSVIHRDLKPTNIIVTDGSGSTTGSSTNAGLPTVKILDFGLARITDADIAATMVSEIGTIKGTLQYMSPEQARGETEAIDVRADVYALGVIFYELLSGSRPYEVSRSSLAEALRMICEEPPRPLKHSSVEAPKLDADLETIARKALQKDADQRYGSAAALGEDVERYLSSQPILARPPSALYQLRKFTSRNRALVGGAIASLVLLVVAVAGTSIGMVRAQKQRRMAVEATDVSDRVTEFMFKSLQNYDPEAMGEDLRDELDRELERHGGDPAAIDTTHLARSVIDRETLSRIADAVDTEMAGHDDARARLHGALGNAYHDLRLWDRALHHLETELEINSAQPEPPIQPLVAGHQMMGRVLDGMGRTDEAVSEYRLALAEVDRAQRIGPSENAAGLNAAWYENDIHVDRLYIVRDLSRLLRRLDRPEEAEVELRTAIETVSGRLDPLHQEFIRTKYRLGEALYAQSRWQESAECYQGVLDLVPHDDLRNRRYAWYNLACIQGRSGDPESALDSLRQSVQAGWTNADWMMEDPDLAGLPGQELQEIAEAARRNAEATPAND